MKRWIHDDVYAMSNMRGSHIQNPGNQKFSFYFSPASGNNHAIRVKPVFDPDHLKLSKTGTLKLTDDWEYIPGQDDKHVDAKQITAMKDFFRYYIVEFAAVWDEQLEDAVLQDYLAGRIDIDELIRNLEFYNEYKGELNNIHSINMLEKFCRENQLVNLYGN